MFGFFFFSFSEKWFRINECLCVNEGILIRKNTNLLGLCAMKLLPLLCADCHGMSNRWHQCKLVTSPFWRQRSYVNITEFKSCSELIPFFVINAKTSLLVIVYETNHLGNSFGSCFQGMRLLQMCEVILKGALQDRDSTEGRTCMLWGGAKPKNLTISGSATLSKRVIFLILLHLALKQFHSTYNTLSTRLFSSTKPCAHKILGFGDLFPLYKWDHKTFWSNFVRISANCIHFRKSQLATGT